MCLIVCKVNKNCDHPMILAANRDEYFDRACHPPALLRKSPRIIGGYDIRQGGTWLGVNEFGLVAAVVNSAKEEDSKTDVESRGLLCLHALTYKNAPAALEAVRNRLAKTSYNPFSLLLADPSGAWTIGNTTTRELVEMIPGWHVLSNAGLDDLRDPKIRRVQELLNNEMPSDTSNPGLILPLLKKICRDHGKNDNPADTRSACLHGTSAGTRSSSIMVIDSKGRVVEYQHAEGFPCKNEYLSLHEFQKH